MKPARLFLLLSLLCMVSCAFNFTGMNNQISYNLGKLTEFDFDQTMPQILRKYQYEIYQVYETAAYRTIETEWKFRYPLKDEEDSGVIEGKIRLVFRFRELSDQTFYGRLEIENMVRTSDDPEWFISPASPLLKAELERLMEDLKDRFQENRLKM